jgi:hypothetical protein
VIIPAANADVSTRTAATHIIYVCVCVCARVCVCVCVCVCTCVYVCAFKFVVC